MSIESDVAALLRAPPVGRISFTLGGVVIDKAQMGYVADAIDRNDVRVAIGDTGGFGAAYSSFLHRVWSAAEENVKCKGRLTLRSASEAHTPQGKAAIFHECVHARMDVGVPAVALPNNDDEIVAYVADALYQRLTGTTVPAGTGKLEMAIFNAAYALVDKHQMVKRRGVVLTWPDCSELRGAVEPVYGKSVAR
jgi:hypothetical protein